MLCPGYLTAQTNGFNCPNCGERFGLYNIGILALDSPVRVAACHNCHFPRNLGSTYYEGILKLSAFGKR